ncbi:MAG: DUF4230 domain-containing protein [Chitinophagaceae bacterium]
MKQTRAIVYIIIFVAVDWWLLSRAGALPSLPDLFKQQPVTIEQSDVYLQEIKALSQLVTVSAYDELVADTSRSLLPEAFRVPSVFPPVVLPRSVLGERRLVLVGKTTTHVGLNMQSFSPASIQVNKDSIYLKLPKASVLDVILNPSGVDVFIEDGEWKPEAVADLKNKLRSMAATKAIEKGLLQQAELKAASVFSTFFRSAGFQKVEVQFN